MTLFKAGPAIQCPQRCAYLSYRPTAVVGNVEYNLAGCDCWSTVIVVQGDHLRRVALRLEIVSANHCMHVVGQAQKGWWKKKIQYISDFRNSLVIKGCN